MMHRIILVVSLAVFLTVVAKADSITVTNYSFEDTVLADVTGTSIVSNWVETGAGGWGVWNVGGTFLPNDATHGTNCALVNVVDTAVMVNSIYQVPVATLTSNAIYTLTFDLGNRANGVGLVRDADSIFRAFFTLGSSTTNFSAAVGNPYAAPLADIAEGAWSNDFTATFSTVGFSGSHEQSLNIVFQFYRPAGPDGEASQAYLDNVRLDMIVIPEPGTFVMVVAGLAGLLYFRRRVR